MRKPSSTPANPFVSKFTVVLLMVVLVMTGCGLEEEPDKVLFINSYYPGFHSTDEYLKGIQKAFEGSNIELRTFNMDTKRNPQVEFIEGKAREVMKEIHSFNPDLIIASDDNAAKYVVQPHLRNGPTPVLFCGVNWTCWQYDLPTPHVRGILEVLPVRDVIEELKKYYPQATKLTVLSELSTTELKNKEILDPLYKELGLTPSYALVNKFDDWKKEFLIANESADLIFTFTHGAIHDWQEDEAAEFVLQHIKKPIFTVEEHMMPYCVLGFSKVAREQGDWIGARALEVLEGKPIDTVEMTKNKLTRNFLNRHLAEKIGFTPSKELIDSCEATRH
ncbi:MAG: ABC transporter substrate-binding protein [Puniceicoccaceae bacterium]